MKAAAVFLRTGDATAALESMLRVQRLREWHASKVLACKPGAAGYVSTSDRFGSFQLAREDADGNWFVITGVPVDLDGSLNQTLDQLLALPFESAIQRLQELDGAFAALYWNNTIRKLVVVTDILGMQPLYWYGNGGDVFALSSDAKALTAACILPATEIDPASWGAFLSLKHPIAGRTLVKGIERVPAGSVLVFDPETSRLTSRTYWQWPEHGTARLEDVPASEIVSVFLSELKAFLAHNSQAQLCLSGGFDSRLILAGLAELGTVPETLCLSHADELFDMDGRVASRVARSFGAGFKLHESDRSFYSSSAYYRYLVASEVSTPSLYLFIAQLCSKLDSSMQAVWEGVFPGCILYPVHQPPGGFDSYLCRECAPLDSLSWKAAEQIFRIDLVHEMRSAFSACLNEEKGRYSDDEFGVSQFVVRNRTRHRIAINPLQVYSNDVIPLTPGISKRFWSLSGGISYEVRSEHRLYRHIFNKSFPRALDVPAVSGTTLYALNTTLDRDSLLARMGLAAARSPKIAVVMRLARLSQGSSYWQPSRLIDNALQSINWGHSDLSPSAADRIRSTADENDGVTRRARELLFYWSCWRRIHTGDLSEAA